MDNPLKTRSDLGRHLVDMLEPLKKFAVPGGYLLGATTAHYPPKTAVMEGWCRCLWGIGPYVAGGGEWPGMDELLLTLSRGVDPSDDAYWGDCAPKDQKLVEMAPIAMCLLLAPGAFWKPLSETARQNLYRWLSQIEKRDLPQNNWCFFRLMVCAAFRSLGLPVDEQAERGCFDLIESCYFGDGWYQDGKGGGFDTYNPMGFHFYGLVLAAFAKRRGETGGVYARYIERAKIFAPRFAAWFHRDGSVIPYGRSLTYRFAVVSFFSACAFAGLELIPWGEMKGIVLRNLRHWFSLPVFDSGGILTIGYNYPNLIMADTYNSPGSPYWALKTHLILSLGDDHPFWRAEEAPLPAGELCVSERAAGFIVNRSAEDAQLLTGGACPWDMNHGAQKYSKFAYSARFGFCVSLSNYGIEKCGCDSALLLSEGDGYWRERREAVELTVGEDRVSSRWQPWPDVDIVTTLIRKGNWHIRIHRINSGRPLQAVEGGFPVPRITGLNAAEPLRRITGEGEALIAFPDHASRIVALEKNNPRKGALIVTAPNLNIVHPSVMIPALEGNLAAGLTVWACAVRAGDSDRVCDESAPLGDVLENTG
jgi:hypothetical protein